MTWADFDEILPLLRQLWPARPLDVPAARAIFEQGLASDRRAYFCACQGDKIVGVGTLIVRDCLWLQGDIGYLCDLVVDETQRGRGIGTALVEKAAEIAKARGCLRLELDSGFHRSEAHRFYEHRGFEKRAFLFSRVLT
jgi:GNAT superfamily N-acetyltransferase